MAKRILVLFLFILSSGVSAHSFEIPNFPFVWAHGEAEKKNPPDIATISFYVQQFDENPEKALDVVQKRSAELVALFAEQKIAKEDIIAYDINKTAIREQKSNSYYQQLKILGYEVSRHFSVKLKDVSRYVSVADKLFSFKNVLNIRTEFDRSDRKKIEADLIGEASQNAKQQAELMATGFGSKLDSVFAISPDGFTNLTGLEYEVIDVRQEAVGYEGLGKGSRSSEAGKNEAGEYRFVPSVITFKKSIRAIFKLKEEQASSSSLPEKR